MSSMLPTLLPSRKICERARLARDPRFDGRFYVAVLTTGIFCRPICPARMPMEENVRYYSTPAAANEAGYRPCMRCLPEHAQLVPLWSLGSERVVKSLQLIDSGFLNDNSVAELACRMGMSVRQLNRLFRDELGATPKTAGKMQRVQLAKRMVDQTDLSFSQIAHAAGYGSLRRFNDEFKNVFQRNPSEVRRKLETRPVDVMRLHLPVRKPFAADFVFNFLKVRALAGLEAVSATKTGYSYSRYLGLQDGQRLELQVHWNGDSLTVDLPQQIGPVADILSRIRRVFDLDADPIMIARHLGSTKRLAKIVKAHPGLRVPGAWDGFETSVRAIVGQQVSVARATILGDRRMATYGTGGFPTPMELENTQPGEIGMPGKRGLAIALLAKAVLEGAVEFDQTSEVLTKQLCAIPGIGPWTAAYISLRVCHDPDSFPETDWVVLKQLQTTPKKAAALAEQWRPWRSYALMYLWCESNIVKANQVEAKQVSASRQEKQESK